MDVEEGSFVNTTTTTLASYTFFPVTPTRTFTGRREFSIADVGTVYSTDTDELGPRTRSPRKKLKLCVSTCTEEDAQEDSTATNAVSSGRRALIECGAMSTLQQYLMTKVRSLNYEDKVSANETKNEIMVMRWIDELLRFLAIKTLSGDIIVPARMPPSNPIDEAWRALMIMPSAYAKVCFSMGNDTVIDRDPHFRNGNDDTDVQRHKMRFHSTLRTYTQCFREEPPHVFWPDPTIPTNTLFEMASTAVLMFNQLVSKSNALIYKINNKRDDVIPAEVKRVFQACTAPPPTTPSTYAFDNGRLHGYPQRK